MHVDPPPSHAPRGAPIPMVEFVAMVAAIMAMGALGIDSMLPGLPQIGASLGEHDPRNFPLVLTVFTLGFGVGQIIYGPLADRFGRRPLVIGSLLFYALASLLAACAGSFPLLLVARAFAGLSVAASRVVVVAIIRDCFAGRAMARVMSLAAMAFMTVPILAPTFGATVMLIGSWRLIFAIIAVLAGLVLAWFATRMTETLAVQDRRPLEVATVLRGWRISLTERLSIGYTLAGTALQISLWGYLTSIQPVVAKVFGVPRLVGLVFASCAVLMMIANLFNSRIVMRIGMRRISHGAMAVMILVAILALIIERSGHETLPTFILLQSVLMASYVLAGSNCSALAMEKMGAIAGTASSVQGFITMVAGAVLGTEIGRRFDGTTLPLHTGFLIGGTLALALAAIVERGRLFRPA